MLTKTRPLTSARSTRLSATADEGVERADDIVAVDPEVEGEVVAGPGRDAGVGQAQLGGDHRDDGLRAVAAGHRQGVGSIGDRAAHELLEVGAELQFDRLDATRARLVGQVELLGLPPARLRVVEEDGAVGVGCGVEGRRGP